MKFLSDTKVYQLKITLKYIEPPIWRRVLVMDDITFNKLHRIIQESFGWDDYHLFEFRYKNIPISLPEKVGRWTVKDAEIIKLNDFIKKEGKFRYIYDYGDNWEHEIVVEKILNREIGEQYPKCIDGERHCPPEDAGGASGYENILEIIKDPDNPEYEDTIEWLGEDFDPEFLSIEDVNRILKKM